MKLSIITTITNPDQRGDAWREAIASYLALADEIVVVNGGRLLEKLDPKVKWVNLAWPEEWVWSELPYHLNAGMKEASGDWVIKCDIDYVFHESEIENIRATLEGAKNYALITFQKFSFVTVDRYYEKGNIPLAVNKAKYPAIFFGENLDRKTDLCYPIMAEKMGVVPSGHSIAANLILKSHHHIWNYDYTFKTVAQTRREFARFARAWHRYFGEPKWGRGEKESFEVFLNMMRGRYNRCPYRPKLTEHPEYIQGRIAAMTPEQFGYRGWGMLNAN